MSHEARAIRTYVDQVVAEGRLLVELEWLRGLLPHNVVRIEDGVNIRVHDLIEMLEAHCLPSFEKPAIPKRKASAGAAPGDTGSGQVAMGSRPRRLGFWLLKIVSRSKQPDDVEGDIEELWEDKVRERGVRAAQIWFWWHLCRSIARFAFHWGRKLVELDEILKKLGM
jgi:hypothetical protein